MSKATRVWKHQRDVEGRKKVTQGGEYLPPGVSPEVKGMLDAKEQKARMRATKKGPPYPMKEKSVITVAGKQYARDNAGNWVQQISVEIPNQD